MPPLSRSPRGCNATHRFVRQLNSSIVAYCHKEVTMSDLFPGVGEYCCCFYPPTIHLQYYCPGRAIQLLGKFGFEVRRQESIFGEGVEAYFLYPQHSSIPIQLISTKPEGANSSHSRDQFIDLGNHFSLTVDDTREVHLALAEWTKQRRCMMFAGEHRTGKLLVFLPTLLGPIGLELVPCQPAA